MKTATVFLFTLSLAVSVTAQPKKVAASSASGLAALRPLTIRLSDSHDPAPPPSPNSFRPFSHFEVVDDRPDTTRIGVHGNLPMNSHEFDRQLIFPDPAAQELARYLNRHFSHPDAPDTLLIVLRQLWLSDSDPWSAGEYHYQPVASRSGRMETTHIRLKAEVYARRDNRYLPLLRIDTLQATGNVTYSPTKSSYGGWEKDLAIIFGDLTENAALANAGKGASGKWITWDDIHRFNQSRFNIPIFNSPILAPGVYASFEEFRDNAPSIHDFEIKAYNAGLAIYLKNGGGTSFYTRNAWGYCDGGQIFLMRDGLLQPLRKAGNSFCFYGTEPDGNNPAPGTFGGHNERHCLYIIDMDTGDIY